MSDLEGRIREAMVAVLRPREYCLSSGDDPVVGVEALVRAVMAVLPAPPPTPNPEREASVYQLALEILAKDRDMRTSVAVAIASAVEHGLTWTPANSLDPTKPKPGLICRTRWDEYSDAAPDPNIQLQLTCFEHGMVGRSRNARAADNPRMHLQSEARWELEQRHREAGLL